MVRVEVLYWKVENASAFSSEIFPTTFGYGEDEKLRFYGMPVEEYPDMIKVFAIILSFHNAIFYWNIVQKSIYNEDIVFCILSAKLREIQLNALLHLFFQICVDSGVPVDPDNRDTVGGPVSISKVAEYVKSTFKGVANQPSIIEYCMFTV